MNAAAQAGDDPAAQRLTGVLKRIKNAGVVHLGVRESAVPFSSINASGQASGYSVDLCLAIVDDIAEAIGAGALRVEYRKVTPVDRIEQVVDGRVDLECGSTTNTAERAERVNTRLELVSGQWVVSPVHRDPGQPSQRDGDAPTLT